MSAEIAHRGIIQAIDGEAITVRLTDGSSCAGCKVIAACGQKSLGETITIAVAKGSDLRVGDSVEVTASGRSPWIALSLGLALPCALLLLTVMGMLWWGKSEALAAATGLLALLPYFLIIYLLRDRINGRLTWDVKKTDT